MRKAKTAEAEMYVDGCFQAAAAYFTETGELPPSSQWTPEQSPSSEKYKADAEQWNVAPWKNLGFLVFEDHYYQYRFVSDGNGFSCKARGDLDGDGITSLFELSATIRSDKTLQLSEGMTKLQPLE